MEGLSPHLSSLVKAFQFLPGVGPKSAIRMALFALQRQPENARLLTEALVNALENVKLCVECRNLSDLEVCPICANPRRDKSIICVVESTEDLIAIESSKAFSGTYFVLHGLLSPIDNIGPKELEISTLKEKVVAKHCSEVVLATNPTVEGETTAQYISEILPENVKTTRIAHGIPIGGELGYVSSRTIAHALDGRIQLQEDG
ncbi:MAG: recombination mediator RecR [Gammaproteobacteria bacterium]|nr:recombination mediator RecR [Gammaproteobacteria bacterium]